MRALVVTTAGTGHVLPTLPVATALRDAGHDVVWATAEESHERIRSAGFTVHTAGMGLAERQDRFARDHADVLELPPQQRRPAMFTAFFAAITAPVAFEELEPLVDEFEPDLIVHELAELASPPLADARGIPRVTVAFSGELPEPVRRAAAPVIEPLWRRAGLAVPDDLGLYRGTYLHPFPAMLGQRPTATTVREVAPAPAGNRDALPAALDDLGRDRPLVYVTFGTEMGAIAPWPTILAGLDALDVDVLVTTGDAAAATAAVTPPTGSGRRRVERFVPQDAVLARASAVISHAGAGTTIATGAAGIPQLLVPLGADQFANAEAFGASGAAFVATRDVDPAALAERVRSLLSDAAVVGAAARLAEAFAAMPSAAAALAPIV